MSGRRSSDRLQYRALMGLAWLCFVQGMLAAYLGYRAIRVSTLALETMDTYNATLRAILERRFGTEGLHQ